MDTNSHALAAHGPTKPLNINEFAAAFDISARSVKRLIARKKIRYYKVGRLVRIPASELNDFPDRQLQEAEA